jgi:hypothetical protein
MLKTRRRGTGTVGALTVRAPIDAFLDAPKIKGNASTLRAYAGVLDRVADTALDRTDIAQLGWSVGGRTPTNQGRIALPGQLVVARRRL